MRTRAPVATTWTVWGYVQVDKTWVLGGVLAPYTTLAQHANLEYQIQIYIVYDAVSPVGGSWWLQIQGTWVGIWPSSIYTKMKSAADVLELGWRSRVIGKQSYNHSNGIRCIFQCRIPSGRVPEQSLLL